MPICFTHPEAVRRWYGARITAEMSEAERLCARAKAALGAILLPGVIDADDFEPTQVEIVKSVGMSEETPGEAGKAVQMLLDDSAFRFTDGALAEIGLVINPTEDV